MYFRRTLKSKSIKMLLNSDLSSLLQHCDISDNAHGK